MVKGEFTKRDVLQSRGWVVPYAGGEYAGPIKEKSLHSFKHHWGSLVDLDDAMETNSNPQVSDISGSFTNEEVLLPSTNYNANSEPFRINPKQRAMTGTSSPLATKLPWETDEAMMVRLGLQELADAMVRSSRDNLDWAEEMILGITKNNQEEPFISKIDSLYMSAAWVNSILPGSTFEDTGYIIEAFRILHYDAKAQNYICQTSTPMGRDYTAPVHDLPLFVVPAVMLTGQKEVVHKDDTFGVVDYTEPLGFGDYIVIHSHEVAMTDDPISYPLRAVHAENGLYDLVMNGTEWKRTNCTALGFKIDRTTLVTTDRRSYPQKTTEFGYGEYLSLAIGVGRLHDVMHIASETSVPVDPDKPEWIPTHLDNRGAKRVELRTPPPSGGKSDIVRCRDCNGRVIIHIDSDYDKPSAACPHCRSKDGVQFPQLLNATTGPEDSPVGQEVE